MLDKLQALMRKIDDDDAVGDSEKLGMYETIIQAAYNAKLVNSSEAHILSQEFVSDFLMDAPY